MFNPIGQGTECGSERQKQANVEKWKVQYFSSCAQQIHSKGAQGGSCGFYITVKLNVNNVIKNIE